MMSKKIFFVLTLILILYSCNKDDENMSPTVEIISPSPSDTFSIGDVITISSKLTDDKGLQSVNSFLRMNGSIVLIGQPMSINGTSTNVNQFLALTDTTLRSGKYIIEVEASDGEESISDFVEINIQGIKEKEISKLVLTFDGLRSKLYEVVGMAQNLIGSFGFEVEIMEVNHRRQELWLCSKTNSKLYLFDLNLNQIIDEREFTGVNGKYFASINYYDPYIFIGTTQGEIYRFTSSTNGSLIYDSNENSSIEHINLIGSRIVFEENYSGITPSKITSIFASGGNPIFRTDYNGEVLSISCSSSNDVYLNCSTAGSNFEFYELDVNTGIRSLRYTSNNSYSDARSLDINQHFLVDSNQVYQFLFPQNTLTSFTNLQGQINTIEFSRINETISISSKNIVKIFDANNRLEINSVSFNENIKSIAVRNNI